MACGVRKGWRAGAGDVGGGGFEGGGFRAANHPLNAGLLEPVQLDI